MRVKFIFYGKLKSKGSLNFLIPKKNVIKKDIILRNYIMYKFKKSVGLVKGGRKDYVECELWEFNISKLRFKLLIFILDFVEGVFYNKYKRVLVDFESDKVWLYLYNRKIDLKNSVKIDKFV